MMFDLVAAPGRHAGEVVRLLTGAVVDPHVVGRGDAGRPFERHVGVLRGRRLHRLAEAERGGEDDLVAVGDEVVDHLRDLGAFGHVLLVGRLDRVAHLLLDVLAAVVVGGRPAAVVDRPDVDPRRLDRSAGRRCRVWAAVALGSAAVPWSPAGPPQWLTPQWRTPASSSSSSPHAASSNAPTASSASGARRVNAFLMCMSFQGFTLGAILVHGGPRVNIPQVRFHARETFVRVRVNQQVSTVGEPAVTNPVPVLGSTATGSPRQARRRNARVTTADQRDTSLEDEAALALDRRDRAVHVDDPRALHRDRCTPADVSCASRSLRDQRRPPRALRDHRL